MSKDAPKTIDELPKYVTKPNAKKRKPTKKLGRPKKNARKWDVIRAKMEYASDVTMTLDDVAKKYGVAPRVVQRESVNAEWSKYREEVGKKAVDKFEAKQAEKVMEVNNRHMRLFKNMQNVGNSMLARIWKQSGETRIPDPNEVRAAAQTLKDGIIGERIVMGLPTQISDNKHTIEDKGLFETANLTIKVVGESQSASAIEAEKQRAQKAIEGEIVDESDGNKSTAE